MIMKILASVIALVVAAPAFAAGWVDGEVRQAAEGPEWKKPTSVAQMPKPSTSDPRPMGVTGYVQPSASDLAAEVAAWETKKETSAYLVELRDRVWNAPKTDRVIIELGHATGGTGAQLSAGGGGSLSYPGPYQEHDHGRSAGHQHVERVDIDMTQTSEAWYYGTRR